jgi:hypothetical protein
MNRQATSFDPKERAFVVLFCLCAALRVLVYSAAFPFFTDVDEPRHLDLVLKIAHGRVPRGPETFGAETARFMAIYGSPEFLQKPEEMPGGRYPAPRWKQPFETVRLPLLNDIAWWEKTPNSEISQPPAYYALAGLWLNVGRWCGLDGASLLYWTRILSVLLAAALVWLGYAIARRVFPTERGLRLAVPLLLAFIPQDAFYSIGNDVLSPLGFGMLFGCLLSLWRDESPGPRVWVPAGLSFAFTYLVKLSNLPLLAVAGVVILAKTCQLAVDGKLRAAGPGLALMAAGALLPIGCWMLWCLQNYGDLTGSGEKMKLLTWSYKPLSGWWGHPLFTLRGAWIFVSELMATFWRGEIHWHGQSLASPVADTFYSISSLLFPGLAMAGLCKRSAPQVAERRTIQLCFWCVAAAVLFLACLSVGLDFGNCVYPSRDFPYFVSGRLISGAAIPFVVLYVIGLDHALRWTKRNWPLTAALVITVLLMTISEVIVHQAVFLSEYNWFHQGPSRAALNLSNRLPFSPRCG